MAVLTIELSNQISKLICQANNYEGDNIYQDVFYQSDLVDGDATADGSGTVFLVCGDMLMWDEKDKEWCLI